MLLNGTLPKFDYIYQPTINIQIQMTNMHYNLIKQDQFNNSVRKQIPKLFNGIFFFENKHYIFRNELDLIYEIVNIKSIEVNVQIIFGLN